QGKGTLESLLRNSAGLVTAIRRIREIASLEHADLLYSHNTWSNIVAAVAGRNRTPVVWHIRNDHSPPIPRKALVALARLTRVREVIAVSHSAARPYRGWDGRLHVVHNGVDLSRAAAATRRPLLRTRFAAGLRQHAILVGIAGRLVAHKGLFVFAE